MTKRTRNDEAMSELAPIRVQWMSGSRSYIGPENNHVSRNPMLLSLRGDWLEARREAGIQWKQIAVEFKQVCGVLFSVDVLQRILHAYRSPAKTTNWPLKRGYTEDDE